MTTLPPVPPVPPVHPGSPGPPAAAGINPDAQRDYLHGKVLLKARRYEDAAAAFKRAIARQGLYPDACRGVAVSSHALGDASQTVAYLIKAAGQLIRMQRLESAARLFRSIRTVYPAAPNLFSLAARAAARARHWETARELFAHAAAFSPHEPELVLGQAEALTAMGRVDEALELVESMLFQGWCLHAAEALYQRITGEAWRETPGALPAPPVQAAPSPPRTLVVVDDEPHIRMLMEETLEPLEDEGVCIFFAKDGREGLDTIRRERPGLVFLDVMMPHLNGYQVCEHVKADPALCGACIVMLSAKGQEVDRIRGEAAGADVYMTKPFSPREVLASARRLLGLTGTAGAVEPADTGDKDLDS